MTCSHPARKCKGSGWERGTDSRNILAHNYLEIDANRVYGYLERDIDDFERFAQFIVAYLNVNP
jgi:uncharacterized protein YutE (UPF0331/DUF86 family)